MLFLVLFIFFLVILGLFLVIKEESVVDLGQNIGLKTVEILLRDHVLRLLLIERLRPGHIAQLGLSSDKVRGGEGLLEVGNLLLEDAVLTQQLRVLLLQRISLLSDSLKMLRLLVKLLLQRLLVVLLPLSASHGRFSILKSLPCLLVLDGVVQERVRAILVDDGILQVLLLFVG